jgi:tRNA-(ms[2]io[6]A)-hydroxylase
VSLLRSEARHFQDYLILARKVSAIRIDERVMFFGEKEAQLIQKPDNEFRFHSGLPTF